MSGHSRKMVLKNLFKARAGESERLSDDERLLRSGLLNGLEALPTVVLVLDRRTLRIAFANPSAEAILDISRRQLAQMPWSDLFPNSTELATTITAIGEGRFQATHFDTVLERPGREALHVHALVGFLEGAPAWRVRPTTCWLSCSRTSGSRAPIARSGSTTWPQPTST